MRKHDWSKVEKDIKCEIANEKPEGDAALDALFKDIYSKVGLTALYLCTR